MDLNFIDVDTSHFITHLQAGEVVKVMVEGEMVMYSCTGEVFKVSIDGIPKGEIFHLLKYHYCEM